MAGDERDRHLDEGQPGLVGERAESVGGVELLTETDSSNPLFKNNRTRVISAGRPLLAAAQHAGEVRDDLNLEQILDMIVAIATIHGDTGYTGPILQAALDGLRPPAGAKRA